MIAGCDGGSYIPACWAQLPGCRLHAVLAQLVERLLRKQEVAGANPADSTISRAVRITALPQTSNLLTGVRLPDGAPFHLRNKGFCYVSN